MATPTLTPNIGLQVPGYNQANWNVPINFDLNLLDQIFGGEITVPALSVTTLNVSEFTIENLGALLVSACVQEVPSGAIPGTVYTTSQIPVLIMGLYYNGAFLRPVLDYTVSGNQITLNFSTLLEDKLYVVYFK
jgi:hypothetical protein